MTYNMSTGYNKAILSMENASLNVFIELISKRKFRIGPSPTFRTHRFQNRISNSAWSRCDVKRLSFLEKFNLFSTFIPQYTNFTASCSFSYNKRIYIMVMQIWSAPINGNNPAVITLTSDKTVMMLNTHAKTKCFQLTPFFIFPPLFAKLNWMNES